MSIFEIEIASIFSVFAIWFCICTCLRSLYCMAGCIQKINVYIFEIEIASIFSVFAIWFCIYTFLRSLCCMAGCIQNHRTDGQSCLALIKAYT